MRADRLVSILLTLQVHGSQTSRELAERLEVSRRTIHRDMDALSAMGVPIYANRGRNGGWALPEEYRGSVRWLSGPEVSALAVRQPASMLEDLGLAGGADTAWLKLVAALPPLHRDEAQRIAGRIHLDPESWKPRQDAMPWLPLVKQALFDDRQVRLVYRTQNGAVLHSTGSPLGLVARGTTWYLVLRTDEDTRTIRVSRIDQAEMLPEPSTRPPDFDLVAWWEDSKRRQVEQLPRYPAVLLVAESAQTELRRELRWARIESSEPAAPGWHRVHVRFELLENALATTLSLGPNAIALEPAELRDTVRDALTAARTHYG